VFKKKKQKKRKCLKASKVMKKKDNFLTMIKECHENKIVNNFEQNNVLKKYSKTKNRPLSRLI
jgi:hypothetical protein